MSHNEKLRLWLQQLFSSWCLRRWEDSKKIVLYRQKTVGTSHRWFKGCKRPYSRGGGFKPVYTSRKIVFNRLRA